MDCRYQRNIRQTTQKIINCSQIMVGPLLIPSLPLPSVSRIGRMAQWPSQPLLSGKWCIMVLEISYCHLAKLPS